MSEFKYYSYLCEFRKRLIYVTILVLIFSFTAYFFYNPVIEFLLNYINLKAYVNDISEGFLLKIKVSVYLGIFFSIPYILFQSLLFLLPALKKNEKIFFIFLTNFICILFIAGIFFSYNYVLPLIINFLTSKEFFPENVGNLLNFSGLIMFIIKIILGFGLAFQMPVIVLFLLKTRIFTKRKMFKFSKIIIVVVFIIAAVLTPPDWVSQVMLALPMIIILLWFNDCIYF